MGDRKLGGYYIYTYMHYILFILYVCLLFLMEFVPKPVQQGCQRRLCGESPMADPVFQPSVLGVALCRKPPAQVGSEMGMGQYLLIPFLVGWTSIYQLFWCSPGVQGFDTLPNCSTVLPRKSLTMSWTRLQLCSLALRATWRWNRRHQNRRRQNRRRPRKCRCRTRCQKYQNLWNLLQHQRWRLGRGVFVFSKCVCWIRLDDVL